MHQSQVGNMQVEYLVRSLVLHLSVASLACDMMSWPLKSLPTTRRVLLPL